MTDLRAAAKQALEALELTSEKRDPMRVAAITALRVALAQPAPEPVAWIHTDSDTPRVQFLEWSEDEPGYRGRWIKTPLYTTPPKRKPLTEEEIDTLWRAPMSADWEHREFARAIERAHGIIESEIKEDKA